MDSTPDTSARNDGQWLAAYLQESRRPLTSLAFIAPLLIVYEVGVVALGAEAVRNGVDVWLRRFLELLDFGQYFLLPVLTICILLAWHYTTRQPWRVSRGVLSAMIVECAVLAGCLRLVLQVEAVVLRAVGGALAAIGPAAGVAAGPSGRAADVIGFLGAGVYEELLFRMILLSLAVWGLKRYGLKTGTSALAAALATSLVFSVAHHVGAYGEPIQPGRFVFWFVFLFRVLAGVFFSVLFLRRGFGVAAGAHAAYDILIKVW